jgi:hypothetical protein
MKYKLFIFLSSLPLTYSRRLFQTPYNKPIQYNNFHIPSSEIQTKEWRQQQPWYKGGKHNECELYQIPLIEEITQRKLVKTNFRLHAHDYLMKENSQPMKQEDGLEWSENFDAYLNYHNKDFYFNLKIICDNGGAQTRSIRETYHFMKYQMEHIKRYKSDFPKEKYFINILDGNACNRSMKKFYYLINKPEYKFQKSYIFVGDMKQFQDYWFNFIKFPW